MNALLIALLFAVSMFNQDTPPQSLLFIGNSLTAANDLAGT
jgi:hypothetical protein